MCLLCLLEVRPSGLATPYAMQRADVLLASGGLSRAGQGIEDGVLRQLKSLVAEGCEMAEQMLTPQSRCHCMLPLVTMEHSAALPEQARLWRTILQVRPSSWCCMTTMHLHTLT